MVCLSLVTIVYSLSFSPTLGGRMVINNLGTKMKALESVEGSEEEHVELEQLFEDKENYLAELQGEKMDDVDSEDEQDTNDEKEDVVDEEKTEQKPSAKEIDKANAIAKKYEDLSPKLADPQCQEAIAKLKFQLKNTDTKKAPSSFAEGAAPVKDQAMEIRDKVLTWTGGVGKACEPFMKSVYRRVSKDKSGGKTSSLVETEETADDEDEDDSEGISDAGIVFDIGLTGTLLGGQLAGSINVVVFGKRFGAVGITGEVGVETAFYSAGVQFAIKALRDVSSLTGNGCGLTGKFGVPGLPMQFQGVGVTVILNRKQIFAGIAWDTVIGPVVDLGIGLGAQLRCGRTQEIIPSMKEIFFGRDKKDADE